MPATALPCPSDTVFPGKTTKRQHLIAVEEAKLSSAESFESQDGSEDDARFLVSSPYTTKENLLDLETLGMENQRLAQALTHMRSTRDDYATAPYLDSFTWVEVSNILRRLARRRNHVWKETSFYNSASFQRGGGGRRPKAHGRCGP